MWRRRLYSRPIRCWCWHGISTNLFRGTTWQSGLQSNGCQRSGNDTCSFTDSRISLDRNLRENGNDMNSVESQMSRAVFWQMQEWLPVYKEWYRGCIWHIRAALLLLMLTAKAKEEARYEILQKKPGNLVKTLIWTEQLWELVFFAFAAILSLQCVHFSWRLWRPVLVRRKNLVL